MNGYLSYSDAHNKRAHSRKKTFLAGDIIINKHVAPIYCLVRDVSDSGCLLSVATGIQIPDQFDLHMSNGVKKHCRVAWRDGHRMGVQFDEILNLA